MYFLINTTKAEKVIVFEADNRDVVQKEMDRIYRNAPTNRVPPRLVIVERETREELEEELENYC